LILDPDALGRADPRPGLAAADSSPFTA